MKLSGAAAARYFAKPEADRAGLLIYGADTMRVAMRRQEVIAALIGPDGEAEMRLARIAAGDARRDAALVPDAMRATGFFPGPRVVFLEEAGDGLAPVAAEALRDWRKGDAVLVVTAGQLAAKSALRKVFEDHPNAYAAAIYDDPPGRDEVEAMLKAAGIAHPDRAAMEDILSLSRSLDPGDFRQTLDKIALFKLGDPSALQPAEIAALAPGSAEADLDEVIDAVADMRTGDLAALFARIGSGGSVPVGLCMAATRHFRALHAAAADPQGPAAALARARPPVFGPRRDRMIRQAQAWGTAKLELALRELTETDLTLRSSARVPGLALVERVLIRIVSLGQRRTTG